MNPTVVRLSVQALLGRRRFLLLLIIPAVMVALAVVVRALAGEGVGYIDIVSGLGLTLVSTHSPAAPRYPNPNPDPVPKMPWVMSRPVSGPLDAVRLTSVPTHKGFEVAFWRDWAFL